MRTAWLNLIAIGSVTTLIATACVVKTGDDDDEDETGGRSNRGGSTSATGGTGGTASGGRGGTGTGGTSSGGVTGKGGAVSTGGASTTGGSAGSGGKTPTPYCDGKGPATEPHVTCEYIDDDLASDDGKCLACLTASCCSEVKNCNGTDPTGEYVVNQCGGAGGEYLCYQDCLQRLAVANGGVYDPNMDPDECAGMCALAGCSTIGDFTNDLITCMHAECEVDCFEP